MASNRRHLQPADVTLVQAVGATRASLVLAEEDAAVVRLAEHYAQAIDGAEDQEDALVKLGPKLLDVLESLGASPKARAAVLKGVGRGGPSRLDVLRAQRSR